MTKMKNNVKEKNNRSCFKTLALWQSFLFQILFKVMTKDKVYMQTCLHSNTGKIKTLKSTL